MTSTLHTRTDGPPGTGRIVVVDDESTNLELMQAVLGDRFDVRSASSGPEAIEIAGRFRPDIVLLDIMMPGMSGYETCRRLKLDPDLRHTKIILVSVRSSLEDRLRGYDLGADDYIAKPFVADELLAKVRVMLRLKDTEELSQLKDNVLQLLAHEIRTPLTVINGAVDVLMSREFATARGSREFVAMISEASARLGMVMERAYLLCSIKSGSRRLAAHPLDIYAFLRTVLASMDPPMGPTAVDLQTSSGSPLVVPADEQLLGAAFSAILRNAARFSPDGCRVRVRVAADGDSATIVVSDDGPGLDARTIESLFEPFSVHDVAHHSKGIGLGLALARAVVTLHDGTIALASRPGAGTTVSIRLPAMGHG